MIRRISLDQFRGYAVLGMIVANFLQDVQWVVRHFPFLRHAEIGFGYADSVMPQFFFAVGYAYRLTFLRRAESLGWRQACLKAVRRCAGLLLIGLVLYGLDGEYRNWPELRALGISGFLRVAFQREFFQTLTHIALASVWVLPVIALSWKIRLLYAVLSLLLFGLLSHGFYFEWAIQRPVIDGGPLGFLSWSAPLLAGAWAHDVLEGNGDRRLLPGAGVALLVVGYGLSCLGDSSSLWALRQRAGSVPYQIFGAGVALLVFSGFVWICDVKQRQSDLLNTFGKNALLAYILDGLISEVVMRWTPMDAPAAYTLFALSIQVGLCYLLLRGLERRQIFLRL